MKKEQCQKVGRKSFDSQGDTAIQPTNQAQVPFLYLPVKDSFEKIQQEKRTNQKLYRVIKIK